jgi:hypothetical protein
LRRAQFLWRCALALPCALAPSASQAQSVPIEGPPRVVEGVVITAPARTIPGIVPERTYDQGAIAGFGEDTIGNVLGRIAAEHGGRGEPPVVLVNGKLVPNLSDISSFPAEAVSHVDVLPRGSGARFGGSSTQQVYNIALKRTYAGQIASIAETAATEGDWSSVSGAANVTRIQSANRLNVRLNAFDRGDLLESQRHVLQPLPGVPYALRGNVVPDPGSGASEIDPALSALVGHPVSVAGVPAGSTPTLADFAATADHPIVTDLGGFRTLVPKSRAINFGLESARQISGRLNASLNAYVDASESTALFGLAPGLLLLPATNHYSPFSEDVGMAVYAERPLSHYSSATRSGVNAALNADLGRWQVQLTGSYDRSERRNDAMAPTPQPTGVTAVLSDPLRNPFAGDLSDLIPVATNSAVSATATTTFQLLLMGQILDLPAGPTHVTASAGWGEDKLKGSSRNFGVFETQSSRRIEDRGSLSVELPLSSSGQHPFHALGDLSVSLGYGFSDASDAGASHQLSYSLVWTPLKWLQLTVGRNESRRPPSLVLKGAPESVTSGVRYFDVLTGQTVDVTAVTGGNPNLVPERGRTDHVGVTLTPPTMITLQIRAEYFAVTNYDALAGLPPTSVAVMAAFPSRFVRDSSGQLTLVDFRPINLDQSRQDRLTWGLDFDAPIGAKAAQLHFSFNHTNYLRNDIKVRPGLPTVDILNGGALGFGGDGARHLVDFSLGVTRPGGGVELTGAWRSESFLQTGAVTEGRIRFYPIATLGLRAFTEIASLIPHARWAKGARITLTVENVTGARQRVVDASGATPLQYQGPYLDAIGRTVGIQLRKSF